MRNLIVLSIATFLALLDVINNYLVKSVFLNVYKIPIAMGISTILYAIQPWILLKAFNYGSLTVLNLSWDIISDVLVTILGIFYFKESVTGLQFYGLFFAFVSIGLFALDDYKH